MIPTLRVFALSDYERIVTEGFQYIVKLDGEDSANYNSVIHLHPFKTMQEATTYLVGLNYPKGSYMKPIQGDLEYWKGIASGTELLEAYIFYPR